MANIYKVSLFDVCSYKDKISAWPLRKSVFIMFRSQCSHLAGRWEALRVHLSSHFLRRIKVSKQLSGWFLQMINPKLFWLGGQKRLSEMSKKVRSDTRLSQKHISVEMINAKLFWNAFISPNDLRKGVCPTWSLLHRLNCAIQLRSDKAFLSTRTRNRVWW